MSQIKNINDLRPGDKVLVQVHSKLLAGVSSVGGEKPYPWDQNIKRPCTVVKVYPYFLHCTTDSIPSLWGMSKPYGVSFDKSSIENGKISVWKRGD